MSHQQRVSVLGAALPRVSLTTRKPTGVAALDVEASEALDVAQDFWASTVLEEHFIVLERLQLCHLVATPDRLLAQSYIADDLQHRGTINLIGTDLREPVT